MAKFLRNGEMRLSGDEIARILRDLDARLSTEELEKEFGGAAALRAFRSPNRAYSLAEAWQLLRVAYQYGLFDIAEESKVPPVSFDIRSALDLTGKPIGFDQEVPPAPLINRPTRIAGFPVDFPLGLPASVLATNANWLEFYAKRGFDILTYKTVRSAEHLGPPVPNWVFVQNPHDVGVENAEETFIGEPGFFPSDLATASMANSFGIPSLAPGAWREDIRRTREIVKEGHQVLIVSVFASAHDSEVAIIDDLVRTSLMAKEAGADIIEVNFSCPNVPHERVSGELCKDVERSARVSKALRDALHPTPLLVKIGYLGEVELREFVHRNAPFIDGIVAINAISRAVCQRDGMPTFAGREQAGISGWSIRNEAEEIARNLVVLRDEIFKSSNKRLTLLSVGGILTKEDYFNRLETGVDGVEICTGAYLNAFIGLEIRFDDTAAQRVLDALNNQRYEWRTIKGVAKETALGEPQVAALIADLSETNEIVKSGARSQEGSELFASRSHFRERASIGDKVLGALLNRIR
jgi:dihydroorotate dehydrogenase (NAD+) catalytic subunit